jgi:hypothetical protein
MILYQIWHVWRKVYLPWQMSLPHHQNSSTDISHSGVYTLLNLVFRWSSMGLSLYSLLEPQVASLNFHCQQNEETWVEGETSSRWAAPKIWVFPEFSTGKNSYSYSVSSEVRVTQRIPATSLFDCTWSMSLSSFLQVGSMRYSLSYAVLLWIYLTKAVKIGVLKRKLALVPLVHHKSCICALVLLLSNLRVPVPQY